MLGKTYRALMYRRVIGQVSVGYVAIRTVSLMKWGIKLLIIQITGKLLYFNDLL